MKKPTLQGFIMAISAAICWGFSGTFCQYLFQKRGISVEWMITVRMLGAGVLLLLYAGFIQKLPLLSIFKRKNDTIALITFTIFGMVAVQYTYFAAIRHSNAGTATVLQYAGPVLIAIYLAIKSRKLPGIATGIAIILATLGTILLVTHGHFGTLAISKTALVLGLSSAVALAIYTLQPLRLLSAYKSSIIIGWSMLIGGILFSCIHAPWQATGSWDMLAIGAVGFIILFGTLIAFSLYMTAVQLIGGQMTSLLASAEPLSATILAVVWLHTSFQLMDWIGSLMIISTIFFLSSADKKTKKLPVASGEIQKDPTLLSAQLKEVLDAPEILEKAG